MKPVIHDLKIEHGFLKDIKSDVKRWEIRINDRDYKKGDFLFMVCPDPAIGGTVNYVLCKVDTMFKDNKFLQDGYVLLTTVLLDSGQYEEENDKS
jgi:hypothetical protein